jgi:glycosyltransferase involved in cell wall biosynthesis
MRILFLTIGSERTPSTRFRVKQYFTLLEQAGVEFRHQPIPHATLKRFRLLREIRWAEIIFLQKKLFSMPELWILRRFSRPIIFDMDDVIFHEHPLYADTARGIRRIRQQKKRFLAHLLAAKIIITGNQNLAHDVAELGFRSVILPTPVDTDRFVPGPADAIHDSFTDRLVVGWIGTARNLYYLDLVREPLQRLMERFPNLEIRLVSDGVKTLDGLRIENRPWSESGEVNQLQQFDLGIMPLTDDIYSRGKCGFKLLQYMSVGIPTVASPVGVNSLIIEHGVDGFLAESESDWESCLSKLIESPELRRAMSAKSRRKVVEHYSVKVLFPEFLRILESAK